MVFVGLAVQLGSTAAGVNAATGVATFELILKARGKGKPREKVLGQSTARQWQGVVIIQDANGTEPEDRGRLRRRRRIPAGQRDASGREFRHPQTRRNPDTQESLCPEGSD